MPHQGNIRYCLHYIICLVLALTVTALPVAAQQSSDLNADQVAQELSTLGGLLKTTVDVVTQPEGPSRVMVASSVSVESYYLPQQGAVFVMNIPVMTGRNNYTSSVVWSTSKLKELYEMQGNVAVGTVAKPRGEDDDQAPAKSLRERLQLAQKEHLERQKDMEELRDRSREELERVRGYLLETVADYGDQLTHLQDGEYINLVLRTSSSGLRMLSGHGDFGVFARGRSAESRQVVSVPISLIKDYKAGRRSLEEVKTQVFVY